MSDIITTWGEDKEGPWARVIRPTPTGRIALVEVRDEGETAVAPSSEDREELERISRLFDAIGQLIARAEAVRS